MTSLQLDIFSPRWSAAVKLAAKIHERVSYVNPFMAHIEPALVAAGDRWLELDRTTWDHSARGAVAMDVESFANFFCVCFKRLADGKRLAFERSTRTDFIPQDVLDILNSNTIITFNGNTYDLPVLFLALGGADTQHLKEVTNCIIQRAIKPWEMGVRVPRLNHIDLIEPNPSVRQGLKTLHARLHGRFVVDLPFSPDTVLTPRQMNVVTLYCQNDLDATEGLYRAMREPLELRAALGKRYGMDMRSKSDAQIGEAVVKRRAGRSLARPEPRAGTFRYDIPPFIAFEGEQMRGIVEDLRTTHFHVDGYGRVGTPKLLDGLEVKIGAGRYAMGIGGLHSTEAHRALRSDAERTLIDVDVASQYPNIIMKLGLYPEALGPVFLTVYGELIKERLAAKAAGDKVAADGGKISANGVYGKLGSPYSVLYAPHLMIATTLTGQLAVLMFIERAENIDIPVVSANTDGVIFFCQKAKEDNLNAIIASWETDTGFTVEKTRYAALYSSSVNTYLAIKEDGKTKRKGPLADPWSEGDLRGQMMKNPQATICSEAAMRFLRNGIRIEDTVYACDDPRAFVTVIKATAGATWRGHPLGRVVRYYWSLDGDPILSGKSRVSKTEGARPMQELPIRVPEDVDRLRYCEEASKLIRELGA